MADAPNKEPTIRFIDGGASEPTPPISITPELADWLARAAELGGAGADAPPSNPAPDYPRDPALRFSSLLDAMRLLHDPQRHPVARCVYAIAASNGLAWPSELPTPPSARSPRLDLLDAPLLRSFSVRRAIDEALEINERANGTRAVPLDASHLFAALLWLPQYHDADYDRLQLKRDEWRPAFAKAASDVRPRQETAFWLGLAADASIESSPNAPPAAEAAMLADDESSQRVPASRLEELELSTLVKRIFEVGLELARTEAHSSLVGTRTLLAATLDPRLASANPAIGWLATSLGEGSKKWPSVRSKYFKRDRRGAAPSTPVELTGSLADVLTLARRLAVETTNGQSEIHTRHFIAALLAHAPTKPTNAHNLLKELGCEPSRVTERFLELILAWGEDDNAAWQSALSSALPNTPAAAPPPSVALPARASWDVPRVASDRVSGRVDPDQDLLDAARPALRFAKLLTARDVAPPIALGLFGNWGTGKSFFMGLMQSHVDTLTKGNEPAYVRQAAQIEFNAWHYQDTNLWASLALRIFDGLAQKLAPPAAEEDGQRGLVERQRKQLNQQMASSAQRRAEASAERETALERRQEKTRELAQKQAKRELTLSRRLKNVWSALQAEPGFPSAVKELSRVAGALGLTPVVNSADDLRRLQSELEGLGTRGQVVGAAVAERFRPSKLLVTLPAILLLVLGSAWFGGLLQSLLKTHLGESPPGVATLAQLATFVSAAAGWLGRQAQLARKGMDQITRLDAELEERARKLEADPEMGETAAKAAELRAQIARLDKDIERASEQVSEAERQIAAATAEIERINQGGLIYDFLQERKASSRYVGQLGLVSTLREDLGELGKRLSDPKLSPDRRIDRIILYVDDLDRCQPAKVVEVLQAVHLLLAFPYFHVVVGVDARWLRRSLEEAYAGDAQQDQLEGFSAHDYLEKIFQIPYALAPLNKKGFHDLIDGALKTRSEWTKEEQQRRALEREKHEAELRRKQQAELEAAVAGPRPRPAEGTKLAPTAESADGKQPDAALPTVPRPDPPPSSTAPLSTSAAAVVFFEDYEGEFIKGLYEFIDRPRLAGRFVNVYRLLRARAADDAEDGTFAADATSVDYRAALILLAVNVGYPRVAGHFFQALEHSKEHTWRDFLQARLKSVAPPELREPHTNLLTKLGDLTVDAPADLDRYKHWVTRVACYSFDLPSLLVSSGAASQQQAAHP